MTPGFLCIEWWKDLLSISGMYRDIFWIHAKYLNYVFAGNIISSLAYLSPL
jgi:hypothetical protein